MPVPPKLLWLPPSISSRRLGAGAAAYRRSLIVDGTTLSAVPWMNSDGIDSDRARSSASKRWVRSAPTGRLRSATMSGSEVNPASAMTPAASRSPAARSSATAAPSEWP